MKRFFALIAALTLSVSVFADEGMWLLPLLKQMNGKDLRAAGCKLSPDDIYAINKTSLKDAIVHFGGGCTGELISGEGLLVTNHHCGYGSIQGLSTDEHNYLMDGYWAKTLAEELPVPGLTVTFMVSMEDVTAVMENAEDQTETMRKLVEDAKQANPHCKATVDSFYDENAWYLIVYKVYRDVRFVGAPPASMGKFGGETDNWMWPRHTCDFSMFRVYAGPDNQPADYSPENKPYQPARSLKISLKGTRDGDYAMVIGYPGHTQRYQTATQLQNMIARHRVAIDARTVRQDIMWAAMCENPSVQLKYASKYASSANGWKKWQGEELSFEKLNIIGRETAKEEALKAWINASPARAEKYGDPVADIDRYVRATTADEQAVYKLSEGPYSIELVRLVNRFANEFGKKIAREGVDTAAALQAALAKVKPYYRDYVVEVDKNVAVAILEHYRKVAAPEDPLGLPDFATMDIPAYAEQLYASSAFTSYDKLEGITYGQFQQDPAMALSNAVMKPLYAHYNKLFGDVAASNAYDDAQKRFTAALLEWNKGKALYPDANSTMRLTYGHVLPYSPKDALHYRSFTTAQGLLEKEDPSNPEFILPAGVKDLLLARDFGRWADKDGSLHTCFLTDNDITGGNSGSPVLDARGNLIGLAFDGNWESMSSDVMFEPQLQRCICVDIRYVLWMVEKYGNASRIIDELTLVK